MVGADRKRQQPLVLNPFEFLGRDHPLLGIASAGLSLLGADAPMPTPFTHRERSFAERRCQILSAFSIATVSRSFFTIRSGL
jgi:hypothetical protein